MIRPISLLEDVGQDQVRVHGMNMESTSQVENRARLAVLQRYRLYERLDSTPHSVPASDTGWSDQHTVSHPRCHEQTRATSRRTNLTRRFCDSRPSHK